jgi:type II secretory pathway pseudopilin PulG
MIAWFIATIGSFLNGELTTKFILKSLTSILISALIFSFYLYDIRREDTSKNSNIIRVYFYGSIAIAGLALLAAFFFIDSPLKVRDQKFDQAIVNKLSQIDNAINAYYGENKKLPADLNTLINGGSTYYILASDITDPTTGKIFDYNVKSKDAYELCATFKTENKSLANDKTVYVDTRWLHNAGYQCLKQRVTLLDNTKSAPVSVPVR